MANHSLFKIQIVVKGSVAKKLYFCILTEFLLLMNEIYRNIHVNFQMATLSMRAMESGAMVSIPR
jgi:hypothetical protein